MKRLIAAVSLAIAASPVLAQPADHGPTDAIMPAASYGAAAPGPIAFDITPTDPIMPAQPDLRDTRTQVAAAGTRLELETFTGAIADWSDLLDTHVEHRLDYSDPAE